MVPERVGNAEDTHDPILYFLLFDPKASTPTDPRPDVTPVHFAPGLGHLLVRTGWDKDATWFTYALAWNTIDHQHGDGNQFEFYRGGEWLTKERTGYGWNVGSSDYHNTLALENDPPAHNEPDDYRRILWQRGSQWWGEPQGDPEILAMSIESRYVYALGDATKLYNSDAEGTTDITHASRSIVWLRPDHIVVYDRAASKTEGRFKRFWLNLPTEATVEANVSTMTTAKRQLLVVSTLLPTDAAIDVEPAEPLEENAEPAIGEPMRFRLRVEAPDGPAETRFLHVLQGVDASAEADRVDFVESGDGTRFAGVVVKRTAVLFPENLDDEFAELTYVVPAGTTAHLITGLKPNAGYDVAMTETDGAIEVTVRAGMAAITDDGGVLLIAVAD
jgi:hypothetical protein